MNRLVLVCSAAVGLSLSFLYLLFATVFIGRLELSTVSAVELAVVGAQLLQVAWLAARFRTRTPRPEVVLRLFFAEVVVMIGLLLVYVLTATTFWGNMFSTVFYTWVAGNALVIPPYAIFVSVMRLMRSKNPDELVLGPALIFAFLAFAASSLVAFTNAFSFASFFPYLVQYASIDLSAGTVPGLSSVYLLVPSVVMFCSLVVRVTVPTPASATPPRVTFVLPLLGTAVSLGWVYAGASAVPNTLLSFTLPGLVIVGVLYAYIRR